MRIAAEDTDQAVAQHLSGCNECLEFARHLTAIGEGIRSLDAYGAAYADVRARVMQAVQPRKRFGWLYAAVATVAMAGLASFWITAPLRTPEPPRPRAIVYRIAPPAWRPRPLPLRQAKRRIARPHRTQEQQLTAIKLLTDDPNVVIIWLMDKKGDAL
jgi:hypothetical protein